MRVTCEVAPHHFTLTDETLGAPVAYDTNTKMNPPLREAADRDAMIAGIVDGTVDAIATDHAPHHYDEKQVEFDRAPFGIVGLETAVSLTLDRLLHSGLVRLPRLVELLSSNPARILEIPGGTLAVGAPADITHPGAGPEGARRRAVVPVALAGTRRSTAGSSAAASPRRSSAAARCSRTRRRG